MARREKVGVGKTVRIRPWYLSGQAKVTNPLPRSGRKVPSASEGTHHWSGKSGQGYVYRIYKLPVKLKRLPGNYIFAKPTEIGGWLPVHIGETSDLRASLDIDHPELPCVREHKATHVHAHESSDDKETRMAEVEDLVRVWTPPCNEQIRTN